MIEVMKRKRREVMKPQMINLLCCLQVTKPLNCRGLLQPWDIALISQKVYSDNKMKQQRSIQVQLRYCQSVKKCFIGRETE